MPWERVNPNESALKVNVDWNCDEVNLDVKINVILNLNHLFQVIDLNHLDDYGWMRMDEKSWLQLQLLDVLQPRLLMNLLH